MTTPLITGVSIDTFTPLWKIALGCGQPQKWSCRHADTFSPRIIVTATGKLAFFTCYWHSRPSWLGQEREILSNSMSGEYWRRGAALRFPTPFDCIQDRINPQFITSTGHVTNRCSSYEHPCRAKYLLHEQTRDEEGVSMEYSHLTHLQWIPYD